MEGFSGRKSCSLVVLGLCLALLLTVAASAELPFLKPLGHVHQYSPVATHKQGTQHQHNWLRVFFRDHMPWSPGSRDMGNQEYFHHRTVHEYRPRPHSPNTRRTPKCVLRRMRSEHGMIPGHRFHLRGTPSDHNVPLDGIVYFHFRGNPSTVKSVPVSGIVGRPSPSGGRTPPPVPSANIIVEVVGPREEKTPSAKEMASLQ